MPVYFKAATCAFRTVAPASMVDGVLIPADPPASGEVEVTAERFAEIEASIGTGGRLQSGDDGQPVIVWPLYFAPSTGGFYDTAFAAYVLPADVREVTRERHAELLAMQAAGHRIVPDSDGMPSAASPVITLADQARALVRGGLTVSGDGAPNGCYGCDDISRRAMADIATGIAAGFGFPGGGPTFDLTLADRVSFVTFDSESNFLAVAAAVRNFIYACTQVIAGRSDVLPDATVTIRAGHRDAS
jgi:hypothetical protein